MTTRMTRQPTTQFTARLPAELHTWLAERAQKNHRSANAELAAILSALRDSEIVARSMRPADHVCPDCKLPSAYGRMSDSGLCRKCELWRGDERHDEEHTCARCKNPCTKYANGLCMQCEEKRGVYWND